MASPTRSANGERPFSTASPLSMPPTMPEDGGRHARLEHEGEPLGRGLGGAEQPGGAQHGVVGRLVDREVGDLAADGQPARDLGLAVLQGERLHHEVARAGPTPGPDAGAGGDRALAQRVAVHGHAHAADARVAADAWPARARGPWRPCRPWGRRPGPPATGRGRPASTPSGVASPLNSSGSPKVALSRASASASSTTASSSVPA